MISTNLENENQGQGEFSVWGKDTIDFISVLDQDNTYCKMLFSLGFTLLTSFLKEQNMAAEDAYEFCKDVYNAFLQSDDYQPGDAEYDSLHEYVLNKYLSQE